ncbi:PucR family transcriptional regulator ligand-binding domain-containing protein [Paenibacillus sp. P25]|nr:PucR family transcriptional regulator ligand-binding domain-containing protein [Paenibacillus sp. P25]
MSLETERILTVGEALKRPLFRGARIAAGVDGLHRPIRWVHILEISNIEKMIHGEEMILTTGVGLGADAASSVSFMEKLIRHNAACLCIELGPYFGSVSGELLELADRSGFPLIVFPHTVRFVDITQDLHSLIISRHHRMLQELESISREFHRLTLTSQGALNVLKPLHKSTNHKLLYQPPPGKPAFYPILPAGEQEAPLDAIGAWAGDLEELKPNDAPFLRSFQDQTVVIKPVGALHQTWAYLIMICGHPPREYDYLLLDSASLSIAQELLRTRYMEERKLFTENLWVDELLSGRVDDEKQLQALVGPDYKRLNELSYRVCLIEIENMYDVKLHIQDNEWDSVRYHLSLLVRSIFEKQSFRPLITLKNNRLAVIALDMKSKLHTKARLQQAFEELREMQADDSLKNLKSLIGVGRPSVHLRHAYSDHQEAVQALSLHACFKKQVLFYEELGVFELLLGLNDGNTLRPSSAITSVPCWITTKRRAAESLQTLKVYLDHDGSKQIAAQKLYIVRQSLYYRLEKIMELLGEDFMEPEKRIAIQVALRAYQPLHPDKFGK